MKKKKINIYTFAVLSKSSLTFELKKKEKIQQLEWSYYRKIRNDVPYRKNYLCLVDRKSRPEAILGRKDLRHPIYHTDNNDRLVAMATTATQ